MRLRATRSCARRVSAPAPLKSDSWQPSTVSTRSHDASAPAPPHASAASAPLRGSGGGGGVPLPYARCCNAPRPLLLLAWELSLRPLATTAALMQALLLLLLLMLHMSSSCSRHGSASGTSSSGSCSSPRSRAAARTAARSCAGPAGRGAWQNALRRGGAAQTAALRCARARRCTTFLRLSRLTLQTHLRAQHALESGDPRFSRRKERLQRVGSVPPRHLHPQ